ncbi:MAG: RNA 2',3'-cyclic phosphodiesterase [Pirellulaceae bacterium]|jgi:2'-5' RNA ligase|nr:RNA 2',3'-cyclic phosphodiesterase [Pirellulaceae bacterium]
MTIRAFIAVRVPCSDRLSAALLELSKLGGALRPVRPQNLHVTLRFLGNIDEQQVPSVVEAIELAVEGRTAFDCGLIGLGAFPNEQRPAIVWVGLAENGRLASIVDRLVPALEAIGLPCDHRPWRPHLTLARIKARPSARLAKILEAKRQTHFGDLHVATVELIRSVLSSTGARYMSLASLPLAMWRDGRGPMGGGEFQHRIR